MICELDLEVIKSITAYKDSQIELSESLMPGQKIIKPTDYVVNESGMAIKFDFPSASYSHQSITSVAGTKIKNTLQYVSTPRLHTLSPIVEQANALHLTNYTLEIETLTGFKFILPSTEDTFLFEHEQDTTGSFKCKITIENLEGVLFVSE